MAESVSKKSNQSDNDQPEESVSIRRRKRSIRGEVVTETLSLRGARRHYVWLAGTGRFSGSGTGQL